MIFRGRFDDIVFEFGISGQSRGMIVVCDGLPSVPKQKDLLTRLNAVGFDAFYPRYRGTWESGGEFLARSPALDIADFVGFLKKGTVTELYKNATFQITGPVSIVGSSFGGTIALALTDNPRIEKIVAFSPVVDLVSHNSGGNEQDLGWLDGFISRAFGNGYRYKSDDWKVMMAGSLFNAPASISSERAKDILIAYDRSDGTVDHKKITDYCTKNSIKNIVSENEGHLNFSTIPESIWSQVFDFLGQ